MRIDDLPMGQPEPGNLSQKDEERFQEIAEGIMFPEGRPGFVSFAPTSGYLVTRWRKVVDEFEMGYVGNVEDYIHDLDQREQWQEVLDALPGDLRQQVETDLDPIDARFRELTHDDDARILRRVTVPGRGWWWSRLPNKMNDALERTLRPFR